MADGKGASPPPYSEEVEGASGGTEVDGGRERKSSSFSHFRFRSGGSKSGGSSAGTEQVPKALLSLHFNKNTLKVNLKQVTGLRWVTAEHESCNPYAKIYLLHKEKRVSKKKFAVHHNTKNLAYYEAVELRGLENLSFCTLRVSVWDKHKFKKSRVLAYVDIRLSQVTTDEPHWFKMI